MKMTKPMNPLLKLENRKQLIQEAMQAITDKKEEIIKQADNMIGDVNLFEENVHKKFVSHFGNKLK